MRKKAIGIDLGTTNSVMAVVREDVPEIIPMGTNDDQVLRSAVYFSNISGQNHVSFGKEAIERGTVYLKIIMISKKEIRLKLIKWLRLRENKFDSKKPND